MIIIILLKHDYKIQLANNKIQMAWLGDRTVGFFIIIICFYAIMHRTTIVPNKIISTIYSSLFFCPANIYL